MVREMEHVIKDDEKLCEKLTIQTNLKEPATESKDSATESESTEE